MATEVLFAKTFLSHLDGRPPKISPDHIEDPRSYPGHSPYTLPRHPSQKPFSKPTTTTTSSSSSTTETPSTKRNPGAAPATSVTLRSARNPPFELTLPAVALTTSLAEIKEQLAAETGIPLDKIKLLAGKKPVGDSKVLKELVSSEGGGGVGGVELGVMVLGGGAVFFKGLGGKEGGKEQVSGEAEAATAAAPVAQGLSGEGVLKTEVFWEDLKGFLQQRVRDEGVAGDALGVFRGAWEGRA
ncbi:cell-cycle control medial ring component [Chaetomium tenue]|uniref:Cell-cycle control medial ring component n=1 Tax=Chaetomium tenue TaxID=1854479 RepID=A0ACB7NXT3_9PEZI|nr:cell-cycle control medial ring component [Chaetomium globosum]